MDLASLDNQLCGLISRIIHSTLKSGYPTAENQAEAELALLQMLDLVLSLEQKITGASEVREEEALAQVEGVTGSLGARGSCPDLCPSAQAQQVHTMKTGRGRYKVVRCHAASNFTKLLPNVFWSSCWNLLHCCSEAFT